MANALTSEATVAVIGAGTMGTGIAQIAAQAGHSVLLYDAAEGAAEKGLANIGKSLDRLVEKGKWQAEERDAVIGRIRAVGGMEDLAPARLVIEAIVEKLDIKRQVFGRIEDLCGDQVILASNTSSLPITALGAQLKNPQNLVGMHFFNPAPIMKLVEVVSGIDTDPRVAETISETAKAWGKKPVQVKSTPGFIVNRVARPFYGEGLRICQEGAADAATIDAILKETGGFRMGPFELMDLIGHDVNFAVTRSIFDAYYYDTRFQPSFLQQELVDAGYLGRKTGRGFYAYGKEKPDQPSPATAEPASPPQQVVIQGDLGVAHPLGALIEAAGIPVQRRNQGPPLLLADNTVLALTDGRFASERAAAAGITDVVLFDLALDYNQASRIALAPADQASPDAVATAAGLFQALGKTVSVIDDIPGLVVMRTVCMLANEGADAVNQGVCNVEAVDIAMQNGLNYPRGPLEWADQIGLPEVLQVLDNLARNYGEDRYRASPLLRRKVYGGQTFHG